ncbi:MAG: DUF3108 domain-containing protein [Acidobacteriia bacterium]|nr:DUF3108 domain-containing protein [Terriglobia bacterium]
MRKLLLLAMLLCAFAAGQPADQAVEEILSYSINWPSGLSLGEAQLASQPSGAGRAFHLSLQASMPGFPIQDDYRSRIGADYCSMEFEKESLHGKRKASEKSTFNSSTGAMTRETSSGGGKRETQVGACARDALAFLYFLRRELAQGRIPPAQVIYFGSPYDVKLQYAGVQRIPSGDEMLDTEQMTVTIKGPASEVSFEIYFARDPARTPVLVKLPLPVGTFSMELLR